MLIWKWFCYCTEIVMHFKLITGDTNSMLNVISMKMNINWLISLRCRSIFSELRTIQKKINLIVLLLKLSSENIILKMKMRVLTSNVDAYRNIDTKEVTSHSFMHSHTMRFMLFYCYSTFKFIRHIFNSYYQ